MVHDFDRVHINDKGAWFKWGIAEDDGLEKYYTVPTASGTKYLLSNNMTYKDRTEFHRLYKAHNRAHYLATFAGLWLSVETVVRDPWFRKLAVGWRFASVFGMTVLWRGVFNWHNAYRYQPLLGAYMRKY